MCYARPDFLIGDNWVKTLGFRVFLLQFADIYTHAVIENCNYSRQQNHDNLQCISKSVMYNMILNEFLGELAFTNIALVST